MYNACLGRAHVKPQLNGVNMASVHTTATTRYPSKRSRADLKLSLVSAQCMDPDDSRYLKPYPPSILCLVVGAGFAVVANELEATDHFANSEESNTLSQNNTASGKLGGVQVPCLVEKVLRGVENAAVLDRPPQVLVVALHRGDGTASC